MKYSFYKTVTYSFNEEGHRLVYAFRTEQMLLISNEVGEKIINNEIDSLDQTLIDKFLDMKVLVPSEENELETIVLDNIDASNSYASVYLTIFTSGNCQLGCVYCGQTHSPKKVNPELYPHILQYVENQIVSLNRTHVFIGWFGGEPLLGLDTIRTLTPEIKKLTQKYNCTYGARTTTNGLLLNKKNFQILLDNEIKDITVSIDGVKEYHDARRFTKGKEGSFDVIIKNLDDIFTNFDINGLGVIMRLRLNVDSHNHEGIIPLLEMIKEKGWGPKINTYDIALIHSWGNDAHLRSMPMPEFSQIKMNFFIKMYELGLIANVTIPRRVKLICQAVTPDARYMDPNGKLFDCSELPLVDTYKDSVSIGNIVNFEKDTHRNYDKWNEEVYANKWPCGSCKIYPICGGGCPKSWKDGYEPCPDYKYNIDDLIVVSYLTTQQALTLEPA